MIFASATAGFSPKSVTGSGAVHAYGECHFRYQEENHHSHNHRNQR
jgi:hypothetical protein